MKHPRLSLTAAVLAAALCMPGLAGCTTAPRLKEPAATSSPLTNRLPGSLPVLTTPSYYQPATPDKDRTYTPEYQLQLLADRDFGGTLFLTVQEEGLENAIFPSDGGLADVYAERRNRLISEKYNVELACITKSADKIIAELTEAKRKGEYYADLLIVSPSLFQTLKSKGLLQALDSMPFFEPDSVCLRQDATVELNSGWKGTYGIWGDALRQPGRSYAVYFNTELAAEQGCPDFYSAVRSGKWTIDSLLGAAREGKLIFEGDAADLLLSLSGLNSATDAGKEFLAGDEYAALVDTFNACRYTADLPQTGASQAASDTDAPATDEQNALPAAAAPFLSGDTLFYIGTLDDWDALSQTEFVPGMLPLPKYDELAADYPYATDQSRLPILASPLHVTSQEGTGIMLSALNAASCDEAETLFLQSAELHVRDNGTYLTLPYCIGRLTFDRKLIFS